jgi:hypothetical protein
MVINGRAVMQKADHWSDQMAYYRFCQNDRVKESDLIDLALAHYVDQIQPETHLLLVEDTTELNLEPHRGRIKDKQGLGLTGNNKDLGFFCHIRPLP